MATTTATATVGCLQQQQQQRPLRGISIIIEAEQAAQPGGSSSNSGSNSNSAVAVAGDEMSLKSQISMLLAFGDNSNSNNSNNSNDNDDDDHNCNNLETLHDDHATKVNLETSYTETTTAATTATATTAATRATKLYPQLLLRIGQSEAEVEAEAAAGVAAGAEEMASATAAAAATIISCNIADDVSNVLRAAAAAGETEERQAAEQQQSDEASQLMLVDWTTTTSAVTEQQQLESPLQHTVKIQIANGQGQFQGQLPGQGRGLDSFSVQGQQPRLGKQISVVKLNDSQSDCDMVLQLKEHQQQQQPMTSPYQLCYLVSSGQYSPCETLDSGTGSDLESMKSPDSNSNSNNNVGRNSSAPKLELHLKTTRIRVNSSSTSGPGVGVGVGVGVGSVQQSRAYSLTDSEECDESSSSLSCDSLHSNEAAPTHKLGAQLLPSSLLRDLRQPRNASEERQLTLTAPETATGRKIDGRPLQYEADQYYNFHVNEHANYPSFGEIDSCAEYATHGLLLHSGDGAGGAQPSADADAAEEDAFVGYRDVRRNPTKQVSTIRSSKGTVRGVKNRVRNGVATFLQLQQPNVKSYKEKDVGKVVLYTTSMGIIRDTYGKCANVKQILRTLLIKFEERDVFMSLEYQQEMRDRMQQETIRVPQLFVEGQLIGDAETVERLNESGELRQLLRPYKSIATAYTCQTCGGFRLLPCSSCNGSKKSVHRNHFTAEFVALKCMNCDEVGLVKCPNC